LNRSITGGRRRWSLVDARGLGGLWLGFAGLLMGLAAVLLDSPVLAAGSGVLALAAGVAGLRLVARANDAEARAGALQQRLASVEPQTVPAAAPGVVPGLDVEAIGELDEAALDGEVLTDPATGLFNEHFFRVTLETRVAAARRHLRPVAVALLDVAHGVKEGAPAQLEPELVADGVRHTLRDADVACRLDDGRFALILEDTPENGAVWTLERIRRRLAGNHPSQTLWAGVACYPAHAFDAWELYGRADKALVAAREWHQDRIEVATSE
jgi:GGDEF domain-containing protein